MTEAFLKELKAVVRGRVRAQVPLAGYVYYGLGGPAEIFVEPAVPEDIRATLDLCSREKQPVYLIGSGTNLLVRDGGLKGVVVYLGAGLPGEIEVLSESAAEIRVRVPSHWPKARLLDWALEKGWAGLEFSAGIPGTLGGAVYMNAGTKWGSYAETIERVRLYSAAAGFFEKTNEEMGFKYRGHGEGLLDGSTAVVSVDIRLHRERTPDESRALVDEILAYRGSKQPLERPNCGSVFKNPPTGPGAGRLIEACGLKGTRVGGAQVSLKHANFILNTGGAKAADVEALVDLIQARVKAEKGVELEREVIVLGRS
jgi:UDP-N-acetylmuramate dehydrogenase